MKTISMVGNQEAVVLFVGEGRKTAYQSWKSFLASRNVTARLVVSLETLPGTLEAYHDTPKITVVVETNQLTRAKEIAGPSPVIEVTDHFDL